MGVKTFLLGFLSAFLLFGCAGAFIYRYYGMELAEYKNGKLLGPSAKDDLDISVCQPTAENKSPCVVLKSDEFFRLKRDYLQIDNDLVACQKQCQ